jgi:hypothetical protein
MKASNPTFPIRQSSDSWLLALVAAADAAAEAPQPSAQSRRACERFLRANSTASGMQAARMRARPQTHPIRALA